MNNDHPNPDNYDGSTRNSTPEDAGNELHRFLAHVQSHPPAGVRGAVVLVANEDLSKPKPESKEGESAAVPMHVCQLALGTPQMLAELVFEYIKDMKERSPEFAKAFMLCALRDTMMSAVKQMQEVLQHDPKAVADAHRASEQVTAEVMAKMKKGPVQDGS